MATRKNIQMLKLVELSTVLALLDSQIFDKEVVESINAGSELRPVTMSRLIWIVFFESSAMGRKALKKGLRSA